MTKQTAMQQMYDELMAHEYTIPLELIVKCKELIEMEKEQIKNAWGNEREVAFFDSFEDILSEDTIKDLAQQYYNETYGCMMS
jgi:hypothetical protein